MKTVKNKVVLITGAAMGMGRLYAERGVEEGARVVLWDINSKVLRKTVKELIEKGGNVDSYIVDVSNPEAIDRTAKRVLDEIGVVDVLINNAGIVVGADFVDHSTTDIERTIKINVLGPMHVARAFLPEMIKKKEGHIVNIASAAGLISNPRMSVYAASKWAVIGWSDSLRLELEQAGYKNIHVTTVTPSYVDTGMFEGVKAPFLTPILKPEDIVNAAWKGMKKGEVFVRAPFIVNLTPFLKGVLPTRVFDYVAQKLNVYSSMEEFKGR